MSMTAWSIYVSVMIIRKTTKNADTLQILLRASNKSVIVTTIIDTPVSLLISVSFKMIITITNTYLDNILAVGSGAGNLKTEILNTTSNIWSTIQDYPYVSESNQKIKIRS